jgi:hypothetical protein
VPQEHYSSTAFYLTKRHRYNVLTGATETLLFYNVLPYKKTQVEFDRFFIKKDQFFFLPNNSVSFLSNYFSSLVSILLVVEAAEVLGWRTFQRT